MTVHFQEHSEDGKRLTIQISGVVGHENIEQLEERIRTGFEQGYPSIVIDFRLAKFLPSICFGVLLVCGEMAREHGFRISALMNHHHATLARSVGVTQVIDIYEV